MKKFLLILGMIMSINAVSLASFSDVRMYTKEIDYLTSKGIISGYKDNTFKPSEKITRAEFAKMVATATNKVDGRKNNFSDVKEDHWARKYIDICVENNYLKGDSEGTFRPDDNITYGEVSTVLVRIMNKEKDASKIELEWPLNYMREAEELNLFSNYQGNDLVAVNEARRDSVALMIYNMMDDKMQEDNKDTEQESSTKVDTKTAFAGIVNSLIKRAGIDEVKVIDMKNNEATIKLSSKSETPQIGAFITYQFNSKGEAVIKRKLDVNDVNSDFIKIEKVEDELAQLHGQEELFDLDLDKYTIGEKTYKLKKMNFFVLKINDKKFSEYKLYSKNDLKLKKNDKIKFDEKYNICFIVR